LIASFSFAQCPRVIFGCDRLLEVVPIIKGFGQHCLVVTGANSFVQSHQWSALQNEFETHKISWKHVTITKEPTPQHIDDVVQSTTLAIDVVIAIGGGSVLDAGKAISAMMGKSDSVKDYLEGVGSKIHDGSKVPFVAIPTTSGTGSEATKNAVISEVRKSGYKKSLRHDSFVPNIALVDPMLTLSCSRELSAASGMDAFTQLLESYLSTKSNIMTDSLAIKGLENIRDHLKKSVFDGENIESRTAMAYASFASGLTLANAGLGTVHGLAGTIGGLFEIPHGVICGTLMSSCNRLTVQKLRKEDSRNIGLIKYAKAGRLFSQKPNKKSDYHIDFFLDLIEDFTSELGLPKLSKFGLKSNDLDLIIRNSNNKNNPIPLNQDELKEVLDNQL
jgi:alcohol dehydrogenase class IV